MDYKSIAQGVFQVQNQVRKNPQSIIPKLEEMLKYFQGSLYKKPGEIPLQTNEGPNAIMECIQALKSTAPVCELTLADGLVRACNDHVNDIGPNGACSHSGSDGSTFTDRIERYGEWMGNIAENIEFGSSNPEEIVINLLVDDGCSNRGHRKNILNPKYKVVGVASGAHKGVRHCTVLDYASEYGPKGQGTWNNPPSAFGNDMGVSFGAKPAYTTNYTQPSNPTSYTNTFSAPTSNFGYGGNNPGVFGVPMTVSTTYTPGQQQQQQQQPQFAPSQSQYQPQYAPSQSQYQPQQYQPQPQQYQSSQQQQPTSYTTYTTGPSSYTTGTAPTSYTTQPTYSAGQGTPSFSQQPQTNTYSTPSYSNPTSNYSGYSNPTPNQSPYTQTTQNVTQGPDGNSRQTTTTTTTYSSSNNNWGSNPRDDFGFPQSTFQTKQFGDRDLLKDPFISEHLAKMKLTTDSSSTNLREMAQKEAPPGANGWSINSTIEIRNGQKYTKVVTTYSFPDGSKRDVIKEFMEGGL